MLREHQDRVVVHFAVGFEPRPGFARRLSEIAEYAQAELNYKTWSYGLDYYLFRNIEQRFMIHFNVQRFGYTGIGFAPWLQHGEKLMRIYGKALEIMGLKSTKHVGLKTVLFLPLEMSHPEIVDLLFSNFLLKTQRLESICGDGGDALIQLHGNVRGMKSICIVAPMTAAQASAAFTGQSGLDMLIEPKYYDTGLKEARDRIAVDCLMLDIDLTRDDLDPRELPDFFRRSVEAADSISENCVALLKGVKAKGEA